MKLQTDQSLLEHAKRFDVNALAEIYDRYNNGIYYYALRRLGDENVAEDCTADTFSHLLQALKHGGGPQENLKAYLYRSAHNWITDYYRQRAPTPLDDEMETLKDGNDPAREAEVQIRQKAVQVALRLLTAEQQQVIALRFIEGWELEEVAKSLQKPVGAVKSLQHRAVAALQKMLLQSVD